VVRGSRADIEEIRELVQRFDNRELVATDMKIIPVPLGQSPTDLARDLERAINESEQIIAEATGRPARQIVVVANEQAKVLMVGGDPALFARVENMVRQFTEIAPQRLVTRVIELRNLSADDAENLSNDLQGRRGGTRTRGGTTPAPATPSQPRGGARRPGGGGGRPTPASPPDTGASLHRVPAWVTPCVGLMLLSGSVKVALAREFFDEEPRVAAKQPATTAPTSPAPPAPATTRITEAAAQATAPAEEGPTGITGELRGELIVTPIDSKRIIVQGDQADVDFFEQILLMMERSTPPAQVEVFTLRNAKATVLAPIIERAIKGRIEISTPRPGPADKFSINAEGRSNSLIVSASEVIMEQIRELIEKLDVVKPGALTDIRAVPLRHIRAAEAVATLRPTIEKLNRLREVPADSQASIEAVERNNSVLIVGTPKDIEEIQQLLESIDVEIEPTESFVAVDAVLIPVQNAVADDVAKVINDMIKAEQEAASQAQGAGGGARAAGRPFVKVIRLRIGDRELPELNLERPIRILPDKGTNSLLIFSTPKNNEALTEMVRLFDTLPVGADTDVRVVALRHASAEEVAKLLKDLFEDKSALQRPSAGDSKKFGKGELPPVPPGLAGKGLPYNLVVQHDTRSNTVIVVGRKDAVLLAAGLINELDRPTKELGVKPQVIELKHTSATTMQEKLSKLLDERAKALGVDKNKARDSAVLIPDDRSGYLIVLATPEMFEMIEDLAVQLDTAEKHTVVTSRFRHLAHADAQKLASLLKEVFDKRKTADREQSKDIKDSLDVLADTRSNSLILTGTRDYLTEAESMLDNLDRPFDPTVVFKVRPVKLNSAQNIAALLKDMVDKALREQDSRLKGTPIYIAADPLTDSLLLAASAEDMVQLERWVEILDRPSEFGRMVRIIPLRRTSAEEVARAASEIFRRAGGEGRAGVDINVTHDASTNSVVAFGPPAVLDDVADFVRRLDETEAGAGVVIRIFNLRQADAEDAGELLSSILELRGGTVGGGRTGGGGAGGRREAAKQILLLFQQEHPEFGPSWLKAVRSDISVVADLRTNSLVVTAPPDSMPLMESLINAIDVPPAAAKVRVFALKNADAEQMKRTLTELFERRTTAGGAGRAGESQRELTLAESIGGRQEVSFTTDTRTNSLIAAGTPGYLDLVEELVLQLDTVPVVERKTMVYAPRNMVAEKLATAIRDWSEQEKQRLQELGEEISLAVRQEAEIGAIPYEDSNRIILTYSPRKEAEVLDIVRQLDQQPAQVSIEVLIVEVSMGNTLELGFEFAFQDLQYSKAGPQDTTTFDFVGGTDIGAAGAGLGGFTFTITGRDFNFLLHTLQSENRLNVLSRPHIVAMDNQEASIEVTDSIPYLSGSATTIGGSVQTVVSRQDVGIKLHVTPQINPDGFVRMEIRQEVSDLSTSTISVGPGVTAPIFNQRVAETVVTVQDNETVVLGGLIQTRDSRGEQKVPLVGDIPILGPLFRFQNQEQRRSELLVILTPRVIRTIDDYRQLSVQERDESALPDEVRPTR
jgi:type II secretion system protein D